MVDENKCLESNLSAEEKRKYLNIMKGIAIFLMLWGHSIQYCSQESFDVFENVAFKFIYSFHMPLFMLISGYLFFYSFQKRDLQQLIIHRSRPLLQTILMCTAFNFAITTGIVGICYNHSIAQFFNGNLISEYKILWFLWSVLAASIGVAIICKKIHKIWLQILLLLLWGIVVYAFPNGSLNVYMYPYFIIGFYYAQYGSLVKKPIQTIFKALSIVLFIVLLFFFDKKYYIYTTGLFSGRYSIIENLGIDCYRYLIGLVGSIAALSVLQFLLWIIAKRKIKTPVTYCLSKIGEKSLQIYALSISFLSFYLPLLYGMLIKKYFGTNVLANNIYVYNFVFTPLIAIFYSVGLYWLTRLFEKIKFSKILFGK